MDNQFYKYDLRNPQTPVIPMRDARWVGGAFFERVDSAEPEHYIWVQEGFLHYFQRDGEVEPIDQDRMQDMRLFYFFDGLNETVEIIGGEEAEPGNLVNFVRGPLEGNSYKVTSMFDEQGDRIPYRERIDLEPVKGNLPLQLRLSTSGLSFSLKSTLEREAQHGERVGDRFVNHEY